MRLPVYFLPLAREDAAPAHPRQVLARMRLDLSKPVLSAQFSPTDDMLLAVLTPNSVSQLRLDPDSDILRQMPAPPVRGTGALGG